MGEESDSANAPLQGELTRAETSIENQDLTDLKLANENKSLCLYPFVQLSTVPSGFYRPCCYYTEFLDADDGSRHRMNVSRDTIKETWNSESIKKIRMDMISGKKLIGCRQCYKEESTGVTSLRMRSFKEWGNHPGVKKALAQSMLHQGEIAEPIRYLELKPGNFCNLKCRMCNQFDSSKVAQELKELSEKYQIPHLTKQARLLYDGHVEADFDISQMPDWSQLTEFWKEANSLLPHLETISLAGGEPMILDNVSNFLEEAVRTGHSRHIKVFLASNFTHFKENFFEIASQFELFEFIASVDGYKETQEYIRYPSKWAVVEAHYRKAKSRMIPNRLKALTNITVQILNVMTLTNLLDWHDELEKEDPPYHQHPYFLNILVDPPYLSIETLPPEGKKIAIERLNAYQERSVILKKFPEMNERIELLKMTLQQEPPLDYRDRLFKFVKTQGVLDDHRRQSLQKYSPELFGIVCRELESRFQTSWESVFEQTSL